MRRGRALVVHASFQAVASVRDGPGGLMDALSSVVGEDGTVVMPSRSEPRDLAGVPYRERHCCANFTLADGSLCERGAQAEGWVGNAQARLVAANDLMDTVVPRLTADPLCLLCPATAPCPECDAARASIPV